MISTVINGVSLNFITRPGLFSPSKPDSGTLALLSRAVIRPSDRVFDLGCGYGLAGIYAAKLIGGKNVTMSDIDPAAVETARENARLNNVPEVNILLSDGFDAVDAAGFTLILSNPPYQTDFKVAKRFIEKGFNRLAPGGKLMMVTKRLDWYKNKLTSVFGGVKVDSVDGYYVFTAEKRGISYANKKAGG
jgi:16S rRNA (guanine1207-N2)-methyltransferase